MSGFAKESNQQLLNTILSKQNDGVFGLSQSNIISLRITGSPTMYRPNFCAECGERLARRGWRAWTSARFCGDCARRLGRVGLLRALTILAITAAAAFALGRYLRPAPPPLLIQRAANSPLSDLPVKLNESARITNRINSTNTAAAVSSTDEPGYICGARTKKGTPCHRRVHAAGERCFQHKGMLAMVPLEKLVVKSK